MSVRIALLGFSAAIVPFVSWGRASWLEGTFTALILLIFLLDVRSNMETKAYRFPMVSVWIPFVILVLLSLYHLVRSPVPYASSQFLGYLLVSMAWYFLLLSAGEELSALPITLVWVLILVPWMMIQKTWTGDASPSGPFLNPNYVATVLLSCLGYAIGSLLHTGGDRKRKTVLILVAALSVGGLLLTGSRSAMLGVLLILGMIVVRGKKWIRWTAVIVITVSVLIPTTVRYRVIERYRDDPHAFSRVRIWKAAIQMGIDNPVLGVGPNLFYDYGPRYAFPVEDLPVKYGRIARKPHSEYLRSWAEGGITGAAAVALFLFLTLGFMVHGWKEGRAGPVLAIGMVMFQALFHDITEVFAPMVLGIWWLSRLTPGGGKLVVMGERKGRGLLTAAAIVLFCLTLWINLNGISRVLWLNGLRLMESDLSSASKSMETALALNPILPGAARDLAGIRLDQYTQTPTPENRERVKEAVLRARTLNRLDTVPLRLEAALYGVVARKEGETDPELTRLSLSRLEQAGRLEPYNVLILMQQSDINRDVGNSGRALELVERALELEPNYMEAHRARIRFLAEIDPSLVPNANLQLEMAMERTAGYRPLSGYEEIILK